MNIALIGTGKMGKEIEQVAVSMGHQVVLKIGKENLSQITSENLKTADVAIEFTQPAAAFYNATKCIDAGIPVIIGTTGWYNQLDELKEFCKIKNGAVLYASNFSIGVNLFFELNNKLAELMKAHSAYNISIEEIHHIQKLDKPSGTAITLANDILSTSVSKKNISINEAEKNLSEVLFINSIRKENVTGIHSVFYQSEIDKIEIRHEAFSRKGFAQGAVLAAQWLIDKKGFFKMSDFLRK